VRWSTSVSILHIIFAMLLNENYNNAFEFVKVITQNIAKLDTVKTAFFDGFTITSALRRDMLIHGQSFLIYIIKGIMFVCLSVSMFRMAGQTAGPIETKLDTRTHVHPGSVSVKVNVKVIHVCVRE